MRRLIPILFTLLLIFCVGCRTTKPLPPADLSAPGWHIQQGQAVWKPSQTRPELTGDLLLATHANGNFFIQFSKIPFPLVTAQTSGNQWQIKFGADRLAWHGRGTPPMRFGWLQLPRALDHGDIGGNWRFSRAETNSWRLENPHTGETLEGVFFP